MTGPGSSIEDRPVVGRGLANVFQGNITPGPIRGRDSPSSTPLLFPPPLPVLLPWLLLRFSRCVCRGLTSSSPSVARFTLLPGGTLFAVPALDGIPGALSLFGPPRRGFLPPPGSPRRGRGRRQGGCGRSNGGCEKSSGGSGRNPGGIPSGRPSSATSPP